MLPQCRTTAADLKRLEGLNPVIRQDKGKIMKQNVCKKCLSAGQKLLLKGGRCEGPNCSVARKAAKTSQKPGFQKRPAKLSEYGQHLKEKQKARIIYNISEKQLRLIFEKALKAQGSTSEVLMQLLERRLDNIVFRLSFAISRPQARQLISHGKVSVNGKKVDIPSYSVKSGDLIKLNDKFELYESEVPEWLKLDNKKKEGKVLNIPDREQIPSEIEEQLILEHYSR